MSAGGGLSNLGIVLTIIFAISLVALIAELFYVIWRRRVFRRQTNTVGGGGGGGDEVSRFSPSESTFSSVAGSSKELLYFLCIRPEFALEHNSFTANTTRRDLSSNRQTNMEVIDIDLLKIQRVFAPPRFSFAVKEEERGDLEKEERKKIDDDNRSTATLEERFPATEEAVVVVEIDDRGGDTDATPFSTPCASPMYFTPSASPVHEKA